MIDKVRIKKRQQQEVEEWAKALDIPQTKLVEDALDFYLRHLKGMTIQPEVVATSVSTSPKVLEIRKSEVEVSEEEEEGLQTFTGGIDLEDI